MPILQQRDREAVQQKFDTELKRDVNITLYTQPDIGLFIPGRECPYCGPTQKLLEEVSSLSSRIHLEVVDFYKHQDEASALGINRIPALVIRKGKNSNVRFYGMPSGLEFVLLLDSIIAASHQRSSLQLETRRKLRALDEDVHIQIFVTPTCPHCPTLARLAYAMALESPRVTADVVELQGFPELAGIYRVLGVPKTIINDSVQFTGAVSEDELLQRVLQAVGLVEEADVENAGQSGGKSTPISQVTLR